MRSVLALYTLPVHDYSQNNMTQGHTVQNNKKTPKPEVLSKAGACSTSISKQGTRRMTFTPTQSKVPIITIIYKNCVVSENIHTLEGRFFGLHPHPWSQEFLIIIYLSLYVSLKTFAFANPHPLGVSTDLL